MWDAARTAFSRSSRCLTLPTWCSVMVCLLSHVLIPTKSTTGCPLYFHQVQIWSTAPLAALLRPVFIVSLWYSTLGRIIKVSPEVLAYRDWTIKKWGTKKKTKLESLGNFGFVCFLELFCSCKCLNGSDVCL